MKFQNGLKADYVKTHSCPFGKNFFTLATPSWPSNCFQTFSRGV